MAQMSTLNGYEVCDKTARNTIANHTHNYAGSSSSGGAANALAISDTRNDNSAPNSTAFDKHAITADFKYTNKIGSPPGFGGTYCGLISVAPWAETSGGHGYQLALGYNSANHPRLALRGADLSATSWGSWYKVYTSDDKPTPTEIGAATANHQHPYIHSAVGISGTSGLVQIAQFKITDAYQNAPIIIELLSRNRRDSCILKITFANANNTDPALSYFRYEGQDYGCCIRKSATSTWQLYVTKGEGYDNISVVRYHKPAYESGITVTWTDIQTTSVPSGLVGAAHNTIYIVQQGRVGDWSWRAFSDGYCDLWLRHDYSSFASNQGYGNAWYRQTENFYFPFEMDNIYLADATVYTGSGLWSASVCTMGSDRVSFYLFTTTNMTGSPTLFCHIGGTRF